MEDLAEEFSMTEGAVATILRNPIYNGWIRRPVVAGGLVLGETVATPSS